MLVRISKISVVTIALLGAAPASAQDDWLNEMPQDLKHTVCAATNALLLQRPGDVDYLKSVEVEGTRHIRAAVGLGVTTDQLSNVLIEIGNQVENGELEWATLESWHTQCLNF